MKKVKLYTDGGCSPNKAGGTGGWGALLMLGDTIKEMGGYSESSTNNIMELTAVIVPLNKLPVPCDVEIYSDSQYVCNGGNDWIDNWERNGWQTATGDVKNKELWQEISRLKKIHKLKFNWVKGHANNEYNNKCDEIATSYIKECKEKLGKK